MGLGETLKNARIQKGLSPSEVAESTHMMVQIVEDLEREDFRRIAAPIYGRGFVRLYAELLELAPEPLIRDFMELYAGTHAPAVRTKRAESQASALPVEKIVSSPSEDAALSSIPQRQPVQPKPVVRPLSAPQPAVEARAKVQPSQQPVRIAEAAEPDVPLRRNVNVSDSLLSDEPEIRPASKDPASEVELRPELVVEPEETFSESDEPDLFKPQPVHRKSDAETVARQGVGEEKNARRPTLKQKLPVFKIGGRMDERMSDAHDEATHERSRMLRQKFVDGFKSLKNGVEKSLPAVLPHKQIVAIGCAGLVVLMCMVFGVRLLFKITGSNVKDAPVTVVKPVAPPPDLYVD